MLDGLWKEHLLAMDHLKEGIGLRGYAQQDPLVAYKKESFEMFEAMMLQVPGGHRAAPVPHADPRAGWHAHRDARNSCALQAMQAAQQQAACAQQAMPPAAAHTAAGPAAALAIAADAATAAAVSVHRRRQRARNGAEPNGQLGCIAAGARAR